MFIPEQSLHDKKALLRSMQPICQGHVERCWPLPLQFCCSRQFCFWESSVYSASSFSKSVFSKSCSSREFFSGNCYPNGNWARQNSSTPDCFMPPTNVPFGRHAQRGIPHRKKKLPARSSRAEQPYEVGFSKQKKQKALIWIQKHCDKPAPARNPISAPLGRSGIAEPVVANAQNAW
jgi:hypothetical protein